LRPTIKTIAEEAGVSEATVSYVLNNKGKVSREVRDRVRAVVKKNRYKPRKKGPTVSAATRHGSVAVALPYLPGSSYRERCGEFFTDSILAGIEETLSAAGLRLSLCTITQDGKLPEGCREDAIDGVIALRDASTSKAPTVTVFSPLVPTTSDGVYPDHEACGAMAAERLVSSGCTRCVFINTQAAHEGFVARKRAFVSSLAAKGIEAAAIEGPPDGSEAPVDGLVDRLMSEHPRADGLFIPGSDVHVAGLCMELQKHRKPPSREFHVIACLSNIEMLGPLNLGIDFIDIRLFDVGKAAVETLLWRLQNKKAPYRRILVRPALLAEHDVP
jgi:DNA-binding LacI/PurR family transcriptional regulator